MPTSSFFDYAMAEQGGKKTKAFLEEMKAYIPYEQLEKLLIEEGIYRPKQKEEGGRLPYPSCVLMHCFYSLGTV